ncbi:MULTISPECIES: peptidoglycan-binding domain-containing protein [unclassified Streptomyces]|uniref:peptidoglycan-binding domain-containing protein n=1 Tax=unclassified Streptomyces TaxID=2593676 RepID=UPI001661DAD7|nr:MULTISPECIES: peptidoglycan-binding domain-containing protein [unclassified Streptomyces]MBD0839286.1 peptidoglycan-binding protein [Streptomyces sp. TRM68416]
MRIPALLGSFAVATALVLVPVSSATAHAAGTASAAAYKCNIVKSGEYWYAGHYSGMTVVPSATTVTAAGIEAQCLLKDIGYYTGTVDGYFGPLSQDAMKRYQRLINQQHNVGLAVDGWPGPKSWPWLRR